MSLPMREDPLARSRSQESSMEFIEIGPAPTCENCAQVGSDDYPVRSRRECAVFMRMLERMFPVPDGLNVRFKVKAFNHEFGVYREVVVEYDGSSREGLEFALRAEREGPESWDEVARFELLWHERRAVYDSAVREGRMQVAQVPECLREAMPPPVPSNRSFTELVRAYGL
jgi:hypothetical protein